MLQSIIYLSTLPFFLCFSHISRPSPSTFPFCSCSQESPIICMPHNFMMDNLHIHGSISFVCLFHVAQVARSRMKHNLHTRSTHNIQFRPICHHNLATHKLIQGTRVQLLSAQADGPVNVSSKCQSRIENVNTINTQKTYIFHTCSSILQNQIDCEISAVYL